MEDPKRFVVYIDGAIQGPLSIPELWALPGFSSQTTVCREGEDGWGPAEGYPEISYLRYAAVVEVAVEDVAQSNKRTWRDSIVDADVSEEAIARYRPPVVVQSGDTVSPLPRTNAPMPAQPKRQWPSWLLRHRKNILLGVLVSGLIGAYGPQGDSIASIAEGLTGPDGSLPLSAITHGWSGRARPKAGPWRKMFSVKSAPSAAQKKVVPAVSVVEIGSEDMGNGFIEKTVVITRVVDGMQIQETKVRVVPVAKAKKHRRKVSRIDPTFPPIS